MEFGLQPHCPYVGMPLAPRRCQIKINWLNWNRPNAFPLHRLRWLMFSDESIFLLFRYDRRQCVYRRVDQRYSDNCLLEHDCFGGDLWADVVGRHMLWTEDDFSFHWRWFNCSTLHKRRPTYSSVRASAHRQSLEKWNAIPMLKQTGCYSIFLNSLVYPNIG